MNKQHEERRHGHKKKHGDDVQKLWDDIDKRDQEEDEEKDKEEE